jgi:hypothetical protein
VLPTMFEAVVSVVLAVVRVSRTAIMPFDPTLPGGGDLIVAQPVSAAVWRSRQQEQPCESRQAAVITRC